ncbi:cytosolic iron-sulfur protein assembly protein-like protein [Perkinsela sp. CCAP 1560/4]|nr:cytosolic iron-sulfur protein assembly protein-like protein [Perkinsela sp. CCAP 1560/4]|eukprot:KNH09504.1 cytosolic iron-sulfur protein assembly protein-like protein [Perkinsela sp. CCAP 1560/4]
MIDITVIQENVESDEILHPLWSTKLCEKGVWCTVWHPSGKLLAVSLQDLTIQIIDVEGRMLLRFRTGHTKSIRRLAWDPSGKLLCTCSFDGTASIFAFSCMDANPFQIEVLLLDSLDGHESEVKSCAFHPSKSLIATCGRDKAVWIWEFSMHSTDKSLRDYLRAAIIDNSIADVSDLTSLFCSTHSYEFHLECIAVLEEHTQDVKNVHWNKTTGELMSCSYDNTVNVWHDFEEEWSLKETLNGSRGTVWDISEYVSSASKIFMVSVGAKGSCVLWQSSLDSKIKEHHWKSVASLRGLHIDEIFGCDINSMGVLAACSGDNCVSLLKLGTLLRTFPDNETKDDIVARRSITVQKLLVHEDDVNMVQWSPMDDSVMATCGEDGYLKLWRIPNSFLEDSNTTNIDPCDC